VWRRACRCARTFYPLPVTQRLQTLGDSLVPRAPTPSALLPLLRHAPRINAYAGPPAFCSMGITPPLAHLLPRLYRAAYYAPLACTRVFATCYNATYLRPHCRGQSSAFPNHIPPTWTNAASWRNIADGRTQGWRTNAYAHCRSCRSRCCSPHHTATFHAGYFIPANAGAHTHRTTPFGTVGGQHTHAHLSG